MLFMAYRTAVQESTDCTPAKLMMGHKLQMPIDLLYGSPGSKKEQLVTEYAKNLQESLEVAHEFARQKLNLTASNMKRPYIDASADCYETGTTVWLYSPGARKGFFLKLLQPWSGPYLVIKRINYLVHRVQLNTSLN